MFGNIGPWELVFILLIALIVVGPGKLPDVARSLGKGISEFKKVTSGVRKEFENAVNLDDLTKPAPPKTVPPNPLDPISSAAAAAGLAKTADEAKETEAASGPEETSAAEAPAPAPAVENPDESSGDASAETVAASTPEETATVPVEGGDTDGPDKNAGDSRAD